MKKFIFFAVIAAFLTVPVFSQNDIRMNLNIGYLGIGANLPIDNEYDIETHFSLVSFGMESRATNLGFSFSPFVFTSWSGGDSGDSFIDSGSGGISLINLNLYWNVLNGRSFYFGPFTSINYLFVDEEFYWDRYVFTAGIQLGMRLEFRNFNYNLFTFEAGYRNINGTSKYYVCGKVDILALFFTTVFGGFIY